MLNALKNIFKPKKPAAFQPTNALEVALQRRMFETNPRQFFEAFMTREVFLIIRDSSSDERLSVETGPEIAGVRYAFVYTSKEALAYNEHTNGIDLSQRQVAHLKGQDVFEMLLAANIGINLNAGAGDILLMAPANLEFILKTLKDGPLSQVTTEVIKEQEQFQLGIPAEVPAKKLAGLAEFLRQTPQVERFQFGLMIRGENMSFWLGVVPAAGNLDLAEVGAKISGLWNDIREAEGFPQRPVDMQLLTPERADALVPATILITRDGVHEPRVT